MNEHDNDLKGINASIDASASLSISEAQSADEAQSAPEIQPAQTAEQNTEATANTAPAVQSTEAENTIDTKPAAQVNAVSNEENSTENIPAESADAVQENSDPLGIPINTPLTPRDLTSRHIEYNEVFEDTLYFINGIVQEYRFYPEILTMIKTGNTTVSMNRSIVKKQINEDWVKAIEDCIPHLDKMVRNPSRIIEQNEEVLPIELSRHINSRSIQHLGQHTDYINSIDEDGTITPSKILNVFNDETINTYENRFVNTLLMRLFIFVSKRYSQMFSGENLENCAKLDLLTEFSGGATHGKMHFGIEIIDPADSTDARPGQFSLADRVRRLNEVVSAYQSSALVKQLGRSYIRPPVMRTNAIMKNKDLKQCLLLWQFIESYEDIGVKIEHEEQALKPDEKYLDELYNTLALQYVIFKHNTGTVVDEKNMTMRRKDKVYKEPDFVFDVPEIEDEQYSVYDSEYRKIVNIDAPIGKRPFSEDELRIKQAIEAALIADEFYQYPEENEDLEVDPADVFTAPDGRKIRVRYRKSFEAKLIASEEKTKTYYSDIKSFITAYRGVKSKISWSHERFYIGRRSYAKFAIAGKTLNVYLSLDPLELEDSKYIFTDASGIKKYQDTPVRLKIRSDRACRWACELISIMMAKDGIEQGEIKPLPLIPYEDKLPLIARGLIHLAGTDLATGEPVEEDELKRLMGILPEEDEVPEEPAPVEEKPAPVSDNSAPAEAPAEENAPAEQTELPPENAEQTPAEPAEQTAPVENTDLGADGEESPDAFALYRRSFRAKIIQSDDEVKTFYVTVRSYLQNYGMKSSFSWDNETFHIGRKQYAKLGINGKTLILYLALDPAEFEGSKYFFENVGGRKKYERTPFKFKIRSERAVTWARELIDNMAFADSLKYNDEPPLPIPPFESTDALVNQGLIRVNKELLETLGDSMQAEPVPVTREAEAGRELPIVAEEYSEMRSDGITEEEALLEAPVDREELLVGASEGESTVTEAREAPKKYVPDEEESTEGAPVEAPAEEKDGFSGMYIRRSLLGKLHQADDDIKEYYTLIKNKLMSYPKMKCQDSWDNETFHYERNRYARLALSGKTLALYLALNPDDYEGTKYFYNDCSGVRKYERTPMKLRIRTNRALTWAMELIDDLALKHSFGEPSDKSLSFELPYKSDIALYDEGMARVDEGLLLLAVESGDEGARRMLAHIRGEDIVAEPEVEQIGETATLKIPEIRYRKSFEAKLIMAPEKAKLYYMQLRNKLLGYKRVNAWGSFSCESYRRGRTHLAKMVISGKTLNLYLNIDPQSLEGTKYNYTDSSEKRKYSRTPTRLKIRSDRACVWAAQLIERMMATLEIPEGVKVEEYFDIPEESFESLVARGLIRAVVKGAEAQTESSVNAPAQETSPEHTAESAPAEQAPAEQTATDSAEQTAENARDLAEASSEAVNAGEHGAQSTVASLDSSEQDIPAESAIDTESTEEQHSEDTASEADDIAVNTAPVSDNSEENALSEPAEAQDSADSDEDEDDSDDADDSEQEDENGGRGFMAHFRRIFGLPQKPKKK